MAMSSNRLGVSSAQHARLYRHALVALAVIITICHITVVYWQWGTIIVNRQLSAGQAATAFTLPSLTGEPVTLSEFRGRPVLLTFVSLNCEVAMSELAELNAWAGTRPAVAAVVIMLEPAGDVVAQIDSSREAAGNLIVLTGGERVFRAYGAYRTPTSFVIDSAGVVRYSQSGGASTARHFDRYIQYLNVIGR